MIWEIKFNQIYITMKKLFLLLALCGIVAIGCSKDDADDNINNGGNTEQPGDEQIPDDAYITLNKEIITFAPDGESVKVEVYSNYKWKLTNYCDWVTTSASGGKACEDGKTITLTTDLTYEDRWGTIVFSCGKAEKVLLVSQSFKENTFNVPAEGGTIELKYQTSVKYEVVIPKEAQSWISLASNTQALASGRVALNIAFNTTGVKRSAVVKVMNVDDNSQSTEYTITQERNMDCVILYTTTNGNTITPYSFDYLTNTYEDGVGILAFDSRKVNSIGDYTFENCTSLTSISIPNSITKIGKQAFYGCTGELIIDSKIVETNYNGDSFPFLNGWLKGSKFSSLTIGNSVTSIGDYTFTWCDSLTSVTIGNGVTSIGEGAFNGCNKLTSITIPDSVTSIGAGAFKDCRSMRSIAIPNSVTSIEDYAFVDCRLLRSIAIPDGITSIGAGTFYNCSSLTSVTIPDSVTTIGNSAFYECSSLTSVTIPDSVTTIGWYAFAICSSLKEVYCTPTTPPVALSYDDYWYAFSGNASGRKIYVPRNSVSAYRSKSHWSDYGFDIVGYDF